MTVSFTDWEGTCLAHHGIRGQKWGIRRYQNQDGSLTEEGREHYSWGKGDYQSIRSKRLNKQIYRHSRKGAKLAKKFAKDYGSDIDKISKDKRALRYDKKGKKLNEKMSRSIESDFRIGKKKTQKQNFKDLKKLNKEINKEFKNGVEKKYENSILKRGQKLISDKDKKRLGSLVREHEKKSLNHKPVDAHEYYRARDKIVNDILGKYANKKLIPFGSSARRVMTQIVSNAASDEAFKGDYTKFLEKYKPKK